MTDFICPFCKTKLPINDDDLIKLGRAQMKQEILKLMEKNKNE